MDSVMDDQLRHTSQVTNVLALRSVHIHIYSAENNYLVMLGHMSKQTQLWSDAQIIWSDVIFQ